jgi:hypothetical protein
MNPTPIRNPEDGAGGDYADPRLVTFYRHAKDTTSCDRADACEAEWCFAQTTLHCANCSLPIYEVES